MDAKEMRLSLGRTIRRLRATRGYSQESFADRVSLHRTYVGSIERAERNVSLDNLVRIAAGLGIPLSRLIAEAETTAMGGHKGDAD